jgi:hypothetical protein
VNAAGSAAELPARLAALPRRELPGGVTVITASTARAWLLGLGGLDSLAPDQALELRSFCVDTLTVRFALDLIWLDRHGRVVRVDRAVPPRRVRVCWRARRVIETAAGNADAYIAALS